MGLEVFCWARYGVGENYRGGLRGMNGKVYTCETLGGKQRYYIRNSKTTSNPVETKKPIEPIPPMRRGANSYKPEDIRRWGVQRFMSEVAPKEPLEIPDLGFSEEENRRMDELLKLEREASANGLCYSDLE